MKTRLFAALLAVMMIFGTVSVSAADLEGLVGVVSDKTSKNAILLNTMEVLQGDENQNANLDAKVTRAEMAAFIFRIGTSYTGEDFVGGINTTTFEDLAENGWYLNYVSWAVAKNIISGRDNGKTFDPDADVSYDEAIKMVVTLLGYIEPNFKLSYPLDYNIKFRDILKEQDLTMADVLPNYKGDVVGTRYTITRGEVIDMLMVALKADRPAIDLHGVLREHVDGTSLLETVWGEEALVEEHYIVIATDKAHLPGYANAATGKIKILPYKVVSGKKVIDTSATIQDVTAAAYGLDATKELLGAYYTSYKFTNDKNPNGIILTALTEATYYTAIEDATVEAYLKKVSNVDEEHLKINGYEFRADNTNLDYTVSYYAENGTPTFETAATSINLYNAVKAGQEVYVVAYDLFNDGSIDYFDWAVKEIGIYGAEYKSASNKPANDMTKIYELATNKTTLHTVKFAALKTSTYSTEYASQLVLVDKDYNDTPVTDSVITYYNVGNKYVIDDVIAPVKGTVTKVTDSDAIKFTVKLSDGSRAEYVRASGTAPIANMAVSTTALNDDLVPTTETNFIVYGNKIVTVFDDPDAVVPTTYGATEIALFYGIGYREVSFTTKYIPDPTNPGKYLLQYVPEYTLYALVANEKTPGTIEAIALNGYKTVDGTKNEVLGSIIGDSLSKDAATWLADANVFNQDPDAIEVQLNKKVVQSVVDSAKSVNKPYSGMTSDGSVSVVLTKLDADTDVYSITALTKFASDLKADTISDNGLTSTTKEVAVLDGYYIAQNQLTGYYELYNDADEVIETFRCKADTIILSLYELSASNQKINQYGKKASFKASKLDNFGKIVKKDAFFVSGGVLIFDELKSGNKESTTYLRRAVVLEKDNELAVGQLIAQEADKAKGAYAIRILRSIETVIVEENKATVEFEVYNPVTKAIETVEYSVTGTSNADAKAKIEAVIGNTTDAKLDDLADFIGKAISYDEENEKWVGTALADLDEEVSFEVEGKNLVTKAPADGKLSAISFTGSIPYLDSDAAKANWYISFVDADGVTRYFSLNENTNIFKVDVKGTDAIDYKLHYATFTNDFVEVQSGSTKGNYDLGTISGTYTFFVDSEFNVVWGYYA